MPHQVSLTADIYAAICALEAAASPGIVHKPWVELDADEREKIEATVDFYAHNPDATPRDAHENWRRSRVIAGWRHGNWREIVTLGIEDPDGLSELRMLSRRAAERSIEEQLAADTEAAETEWRGAKTIANQRMADALKTAITYESVYDPASMSMILKPLHVDHVALSAAEARLAADLAAADADRARELAFIESVRGQARASTTHLMLHPAIAPWAKLPAEQRQKFEAVHAIIRGNT